MTQGALEAISGVIGQADNDIGGFLLTRLTEAVAPTTALSATYTWDGTTTVLTADTSEVEVGDWIALDSDGQLYQVVGVTTDTSVQIDNPTGYDIPTGSTQSSKATRNIPVESVLDWEAEGKVGIDGVVYYYTLRTDTELQNVTHIQGGVLFVGVKQVHAVESTVMDLNRSRSALDQLRRAMLVAYAEGEDLNAIGRNLGVDRYFFLGSDTVFRDIIQAVAYNPKGTMFGLELALDAMLGEGNYEIVEDLITDPCTVFIRFLGTAATDEISEGKTFLSGAELQPPTSSTTVGINDSIVDRGSVSGVRWADEDLVTDCTAAYPSADIIEEYPGDTPHAAWAFFAPGATEGVNVTLTGSATEFTTAAPTSTLAYRRGLRIQPESYAYASALLTVPTGAAVETVINTVLTLDDSAKKCQVGIFADTASTFQVGFITPATYVFVGSVTQLSRDQFHAITIRKRGEDHYELYVDGSLVETIDYSGLQAVSLTTYMFIGHFRVGATSNRLQVKELSVWVRTFTDYWSARGTGGVGTGGSQRLDIGSTILVSGDVGKIVDVSNAATPVNNGRFEIESLVSSQVAVLRGPLNTGLQAQYLGSNVRVAVPETGQLFQYPDDIGKQLVISGSTLGNDGTYQIATLLQPGTLQDLSSGATPVPEKTNIAEVTAASFVPETGLDWRVNPVFTVESPVDWVMSDAGSWVTTFLGTTLYLRQGLPLSAAACYRVLAVTYSNVLSAQLLLNTLVQNAIIEEDPEVLFRYYPFYLADPLGYVRSYVDALTAAGVIPEFLVV